MRGRWWWGALAAALLGSACHHAAQRTEVPPSQLEALARRVEAARELRFRAPVTADSIVPAAVPALLAAELDLVMPPDQLRREHALGAALGLLPADVDLRELLLRWQAHAVAGFYSPSSQRLFVVAGAAGAGGVDQRGVLVHELAHALQDQHTRLLDARIGIRENDDLIFALGAFLEGDALWTELRDEAGATGFPQASGRDFAKRFAVDAPEAEGVPRLLRDSFLRQYPLGYALATELVERGGVAALTAALADPPLSSEELLHRERYLSRARRRPLAWLPESSHEFAPDPGCELAATTSYGELGVGIWLAEHGASASEVDTAADGWDGDRAWRLDCPAGSALAWLIQADDAKEAAELEAAVVRAVARARPLGPLVVERRDVRVLLSAGLPPLGRAYLLATLEARRYESLDALLRDRPEILERAAEQRGVAR